MYVDSRADHPHRLQPLVGSPAPHRAFLSIQQQTRRSGGVVLARQQGRERPEGRVKVAMWLGDGQLIEARAFGLGAQPLPRLT